METSTDSYSDKNDEWYIKDLQMAAKMGKLLLERNHDLEDTLQQQQDIIDDYFNEIQYLTKQSDYLKYMTESRKNVYEQLEDSIAELEKTNQKLLNESHSDKVRIKRLRETITELEKRCDDLRKEIIIQNSKDKIIKTEIFKTINTFKKSQTFDHKTGIFEGNDLTSHNSENMELRKLKAKLSRLSSQLLTEHRKFEALEAQTILVVEESVSLKEQLQTLQAQQEKADYFRQNHSICLVCQRPMSPEANQENFTFTASELNNSLECKKDFSQNEGLENLKFARRERRRSSNPAILSQTQNGLTITSDANLDRVVANGTKRTSLFMTLENYDSGYEDLSLTSNASFSFENNEQDSLEPKSLYDELLETCSNLSFINRSGSEDNLSLSETEKTFEAKEVQTEVAGFPQLDGFKYFTLPSLESYIVAKQLFSQLLGILQYPYSVPIMEGSSSKYCQRRPWDEKEDEMEFESLTPKKRFKSIFLRRPFFSIPSPHLFNGPFLKIGLPFAANTCQILSNAFQCFG